MPQPKKRRSAPAEEGGRWVETSAPRGVPTLPISPTLSPRLESPSLSPRSFLSWAGVLSDALDLHSLAGGAEGDDAPPAEDGGEGGAGAAPARKAARAARAALQRVSRLVREQLQWEKALERVKAMPSEGGKAIEQRARELEGKIKGQAARVRAAWQEEREQLKRSVRQRRVLLQTKIDENIRTVDKIAFFFGVLNTHLTVALLASQSELLVHWVLCWAVVMTLCRFILYVHRGWNYFMIDFCYMGLLLTLTFVYFAPFHPRLFMIVFSLNSGPILQALVLWRNSLVFHSVDRITSLLIHAAGPLSCFYIRWWSAAGAYAVPRPDHPACPTAASYAGDEARLALFRDSMLPVLSTPDDIFCGMRWTDSVLVSTLPYVIWQVAYWAKTELPLFRITSRASVGEDERLMTSFKWLSATSWNRVLRPLPRRHWVLGFMFVQLLYTVVTLLPVKFMYDSFWLHSAVLWLVFAVTAFNGANYYFTVFSKRQEVTYERLQQRAARRRSRVEAG